MQEKEKEAYEKLFAAKWNIPQAVAYLGRRACKEEWDSLKKEFQEFCSQNPITWKG